MQALGDMQAVLGVDRHLAVDGRIAQFLDQPDLIEQAGRRLSLNVGA